MTESPLVSVVMTTRDRPGFLKTALRCYQEQSYRHRELIVVDDGDVFPADRAAIESVGGRVVITTPGATIGAKLNLGLEQASGHLCQKMDDDDWYAPAYISTFVERFAANERIACRPACAFITPFLFFNVAAWEVRRSADGNVPGATLFFRRQDWQEAPFRDLPADEDLWFYQDHLRIGGMPLTVDQSELFMAIRHRGLRSNRDHTWINQWNNVSLEQFLEDERPIHAKPEKLLPTWAVAFYRSLRDEIRAAEQSA